MPQNYIGLCMTSYVKFDSASATEAKFRWMILNGNDIRFKLNNRERTVNDVYEAPISKSHGATEKNHQNSKYPNTCSWCRKWLVGKTDCIVPTAYHITTSQIHILSALKPVRTTDHLSHCHQYLCIHFCRPSLCFDP